MQLMQLDASCNCEQYTCNWEPAGIVFILGVESLIWVYSKKVVGHGIVPIYRKIRINEFERDYILNQIYRVIVTTD